MIEVEIDGECVRVGRTPTIMPAVKRALKAGA
jgi:hypothetical protein